VLEWTADRLSDDQLVAIGGWPATLRHAVPGLGEVLFCHATPRDDNEIFTEVTPEAALQPVFEPTGANVVVCGHTHMPFDRQVGSVRVINAGSVGMPFGRPGAHWLILAPGRIESRITAYGLGAAEKLLNGSGYPNPMPYDLRKPPGRDHVVARFEAAALS